MCKCLVVWMFTVCEGVCAHCLEVYVCEWGVLKGCALRGRCGWVGGCVCVRIGVMFDAQAQTSAAPPCRSGPAGMRVQVRVWVLQLPCDVSPYYFSPLS